jgi:hypothetical protein
VNDETDENRNERQSNVRLLANGGGDGSVANSAENNLGRKMRQKHLVALVLSQKLITLFNV